MRRFKSTHSILRTVGSALSRLGGKHSGSIAVAIPHCRLIPNERWEVQYSGESCTEKTIDEQTVSDQEIRLAIRYLDPDMNPKAGEAVAFVILVATLSITFALCVLLRLRGL